MTGYHRRYWILAISLAALAGYVDAVGFLEIGGFFVSFMSGNTTRLAIGIAMEDPRAALVAGLLLAFVAGVVAGSLIAAAFPVQRKAAVLLLVASLLAGAAGLEAGRPETGSAFLLAAAMGAENAVFQRDGEVSIALTYVTGTLVRIGQRLAAAMLGGARFGWLPYLLLWCGLAIGAGLGVLGYSFGAAPAIAAAAVAALGLTGLAAFLGPAPAPRA